MGATTGPVLAAGGITAFNLVVLNDTGYRTGITAMASAGDPNQDPMIIRIAFATAIAAGGLRLWEEFMPRTATAVAWLALLTVLLVRVDSNIPAPLETLSDWYNKGGTR
jgi:hypothetical protein